MAPKPPPRPFQLDVFSTTVTLPPFSAAAAAHAQPAKPAPMTRMSVSTVDVTSVWDGNHFPRVLRLAAAAALPAASPPAFTSPALAAASSRARPAPAATAAVAPRPRNARRDSPFFMMSVIGNPFPR